MIEAEAREWGLLLLEDGGFKDNVIEIEEADFKRGEDEIMVRVIALVKFFEDRIRIRMSGNFDFIDKTWYALRKMKMNEDDDAGLY